MRLVGTQRRKKKNAPKANVNEDKKIASVVRKYGKLSLPSCSTGVQPLQDIDEVNMFKDDNTVVNFKRPMGKIRGLKRQFNSQLERTSW